MDTTPTNMIATQKYMPFVPGEIPAGYRTLVQDEIVLQSDLVPVSHQSALVHFPGTSGPSWIQRGDRPAFVDTYVIGTAYKRGVHLQTIRKIDKCSGPEFDQTMSEIFNADCACGACAKRQEDEDAGIFNVTADPPTDDLWDQLRIAVDALEARLRTEQATAPVATPPPPAPKPVLLSELTAVDPNLYADGKISVEMALTESDTLALWALLRRIRPSSAAGRFLSGPLLSALDKLEFIPREGDARDEVDERVTFELDGYTGPAISLKDSDV